MRARRGYTLIELIIVMAIISILVAIAVPLYQKSLLRTKESLLKNNLFTLRTVNGSNPRRGATTKQRYPLPSVAAG